MLRKAFKLSTISLLLSAVIATTSNAMPIDYKDMQMKEPGLPSTTLSLGFAYEHIFFRGTWENSYRAMVGQAPLNNYYGVGLGIDHMLNDWFALHVKFNQYFERRGASGNDGRVTDLTVGGLMFFYLAPGFHLFGMVGATVDSFVHRGDESVGTTGNDAFTINDVNLALGAGMQYQISDNFFIRPSVSLKPYQDRADSDVWLGGAIDIVYAIS